MIMASVIASLRDRLLYSYGYYQGRYIDVLPTSISGAYALAASKISRLLALPLPFLSFLVLPVFGSTSTSINFFFFYLTWSAFVWSNDELGVEIWTTLIVRVLFFIIPALAFLAYDTLVPTLSQSLKARGDRSLPQKLRQDRLRKIAGIAIFNVLLSVAVQALLEVIATRVIHSRSILKVTTTVPLPWNLAKDVIKALLLRNLIHYPIHRYLLHTYDSRLKTWHLTWQHSIREPFSLVAAYDHPVTYLIGNWLPVYLPAYLFRFHVLTWLVVLALVSLEDLFVYSGYAVLPSTILLTGMARRNDAHFLHVHAGRDHGNFGHVGVLDWVCGTTCAGTRDALDDIHLEADKHQVRERVTGAAKGARAGFQQADDDDSPQNDESPPKQKRRSNRKKS